MATYKYNKEYIQNMADEFMELLRNLEMDDSVIVYANNKRYRAIHKNWDEKKCEYTDKYWVCDGEGFHPCVYCRYASPYNILSLSSEGSLYDYVYHYGFPDAIRDFVKKHNLYIEHATSWFFYFCPVGEWEEWETDNFKEKPKPIILYNDNDYTYYDVPELKIIATMWQDLIAMTPDEGSCVIGYGMNFKYKGTLYRMIPRSNKQGEYSWNKWVNLIIKYLRMTGCTDIDWDCGHLD